MSVKRVFAAAAALLSLGGCGGDGGDAAGGVFTPANVSAAPTAAPSLIRNGSFEAGGAATQSPSGWSSWSGMGNTDADYTEQPRTGDSTPAGSFHGTHWSGSAYEIYTYQQFTGLANGTYTLSASVRSGGGQTYSQMEAKRNGSGSSDARVVIGATPEWKRISLDIEVTNGQLTVGFYSKSSGNHWLHFDDVNLVRKEQLPAAPAAVTRAYPDAVALNIKVKYGLVGDGITDDTAALQRAVTENLGRTLFLPNGTYLVSDRIAAKNRDGKWSNGFHLIGENRDRTIIKLKDGATGFGDAAAPKAVLYTASSYYVDSSPNRDWNGKGEGNEAFGNYVENLTVDAGNNRGAIGVDFLANNGGAVRELVIRGNGATGLSMTRALPGPTYIQQLRVEGFDYGIRTAQDQYGITLEHLQLGGQRVAGIRNEDNILAIRDLVSVNSVPALVNATGIGFVSLVNATLNGGAADASAIRNAGGMFARAIASSGYASVIDNNGTKTAGPNVSEWTSSAARKLGSTMTSSLALTVREPHLYVRPAPSAWVSVLDYGARVDDWDDDAFAVQKAIDSGAEVVFFPPGRYFMSGTVRVRGNVRLISGIRAELSPQYGTYADEAKPQAMFRVEDGAGADVTIEGISFQKFHSGSPAHSGLIWFEQATKRPLYLKDIGSMLSYHRAYRSAAGAGDLFVENIVGGRWEFGQAQNVWARQMDMEEHLLRISNGAANLWILGLKAENPGTIVHTFGTGRTELLGGALYAIHSVPDDQPAFLLEGSGAVSLSFATIAYSAASDYKQLVRETSGGTTSVFHRDSADGRGAAKFLPLYLGGSGGL